MMEIHWHQRHRLTVRVNPDWVDYIERDDVSWLVMEGYLHRSRRVYPCRVVRRGPRAFLLIETSREARVKAAMDFARMAV